VKTLRLLHLASFDGNIGDNANHAGFYNSIEQQTGYSFEYEQLEFREFYWKQRYFDEGFVNLVNQFDLLVIGGGNYFELWVEHSPTGTSVMIEPQLFNRIKIPVLFNALGVDPAQGASLSCRNKFKSFLTQVLADRKNFVSVRNDGSVEALKHYIGDEFVSLVTWTPDAGAVIKVDDSFTVIQPEKSYVAINVAGDMLDTRFSVSDELNSEQFIESFSKLIIKLLDKDSIDEVLIIPHIFKDVTLINSVLALVPDQITRKHISIAPLLHGPGSERLVFALYKHAKLCLSMRYHANLCAVGLGRPTIGLANYRQITKLYEEMALDDYVIAVNKYNYDERIMARVDDILLRYDLHSKRFCAKAEELRVHYQRYMSLLKQWLDKNFSEE